MEDLLQQIGTTALAMAAAARPRAGGEGSQKSILVTGASSGLGRHLTQTLAETGHHVYAGALSDDELASLDGIANVTAVRLDVTKQDEVDAVVDLIRDSGTGLYALVNNAGVGGSNGTVLEAPIEEQTFVYAVNVEGVYRATKAFAPFVVASSGRIVMTGSIGGTVSAFPGFSAYSGSKHWIEAFTDALAAELEPHGVMVSVVEPGNYKSNIASNSVARALEQVKRAGGEASEEMMEAFQDLIERQASCKEPDEVTEAFMHALFDQQSLRRYLVAPNTEEHEITIRTKIAKLIQLNRWGPHSYSRDQLVDFLDEAIAGDPS